MPKTSDTKSKTTKKSGGLSDRRKSKQEEDLSKLSAKKTLDPQDVRTLQKLSFSQRLKLAKQVGQARNARGYGGKKSRGFGWALKQALFGDVESQRDRTRAFESGGKEGLARKRLDQISEETGSFTRARQLGKVRNDRGTGYDLKQSMFGGDLKEELERTKAFERGGMDELQKTRLNTDVSEKSKDLTQDTDDVVMTENPLYGVDLTDLSGSSKKKTRKTKTGDEPLTLTVPLDQQDDMELVQVEDSPPEKQTSSPPTQKEARQGREQFSVLNTDLAKWFTTHLGAVRRADESLLDLEKRSSQWQTDYKEVKDLKGESRDVTTRLKLLRSSFQDEMKSAMGTDD
jgi:hypothetical protein